MSRFRFLFIALLWLGYLLTFPALFAGLDSAANFLALVPIAATAWAYGFYAGLGAALLGFAVLVGQLFYILDEDGARVTRALSQHLQSPLSFLMVGAVAGWVSRLQSELKTYKRATSQAQFDVLTGLLNRQSFMERFDTVLAEAQRDDVMVAVLFVDLDKFKAVNDTYGHDVGDELLRRVSSTLEKTVRQNDIVARLGGDEFMVVLTDLKEPKVAAFVASKIVKSLNSPFKIWGKNVAIGASVGIAIYPDDGDTTSVLIKAADSAMYTVKAAGKNAYELQSHKTRALESRRLEFERHIQAGFDNREFELFYQPQVSLDTRSIQGFEVLLRWRSPKFGLLSATEFLAIAEGVGLAASLDHWVLREACHQLSQWHRVGLRPLKLSLNVSAMQFGQPDFIEKVTKAVQDNDINAGWLEFELSEKTLAADPQMTLRTLHDLYRLGVRLSIDNFGSGSSSMYDLKRLPIHTIKVDKRFVRNLSVDLETPDAKITQAICALGKILGKTMSAAGVETAQQHEAVRSLGCALAQGYYYAKPLDLPDAERLLERPVVEKLDKELVSTKV